MKAAEGARGKPPPPAFGTNADRKTAWGPAKEGDADLPRSVCVVSIPEKFEGPLDVLLHICQKHEIDLLDLPIAFVTARYLEYLDVILLVDLDAASEYLVVAATLLHIKSKMLLPSPPPGQDDDEIPEEEEDPREALIRRLLEYQKYKEAAAKLGSRGGIGDAFTRGGRDPEEEAAQAGIAPLAEIPLYALAEAFRRVLAKSKVKLSHDVVHERMNLSDRILELTGILATRKRFVFDELFGDLVTKFDLVITFLAILEMAKLRMARVYQVDPLAPLYVEGALVAADAPDATEATR